VEAIVGCNTQCLWPDTFLISSPVLDFCVLAAWPLSQAAQAVREPDGGETRERRGEASRGG
jgi:hypothetical protein